MRHINNENIDEIMFQLLEGEISGKEKEQLMAAIEADPDYYALWKTWQKTVLEIDTEIPLIDTRKYKKKTSRIIPLYIKYAAAAIVVLSIGLGVYFSNSKTVEVQISEVYQPIKPSASSKLPKINKDTIYNTTFDRDTFIPFREKVRHYAKIENNSKTHTPNNQTPIEQTQFVDQERSFKTEMPILKVDTAIIEKEMPVKKHTDENVFVTVNTHSGKETTVVPKTTFLSRLLGTSKIDIVNDSNTRTNKKIIIQNNKYKIIAGF